ncbi:(2Fe-2S) ferredoxin domain-containing protein [Methylobacterium iners]|uniref:(2Fe-2S) ferredoxin domain-containing protein n=1 Tax=Methylobacterium iners TaxID=418707 RepID=A0ABQ4RYP4_9HYPH|nr:(2Fe-2S) ferredoxin domain-containing protein [Methylobacterium iners]GJD95975.1 hypothetical protein OCOJLMKI_3192 [Methylobacterium iners]
MAQSIQPDAAKRRTAKAGFSEIVLVCSKCAKRQGLPKRALRGMLKGGLRRRRPGLKLKVIETGCLGPCPKRALAVATGGSVERGRILLLDPASTPEEAVEAILPDFSPKPAIARGDAG